MADLEKNEALALKNAQRQSNVGGHFQPVRLRSWNIAPANMLPKDAEKLIQNLVAQHFLERDSRDPSQLRLTKAGNDVSTRQNPIGRFWTRSAAKVNQVVDRYRSPQKDNVTSKTPRNERTYGNSRSGLAANNRGFVGRAKAPVPKASTERAIGRATVEPPEVRVGDRLGMLAEDVICSGDATGPDEAKAAKFVNALLADPQSSANVLNGWSKPRGATQSPQDRRNMNAVRVALDDPNIAQRVRTELDASQPGGPALAEAASSMLRSAPRTAVEAQLQVRQCPAVEEQFSQRLGDAAREVANARSFAEKQQAISVFRGTLFADPESARNVLGGKAGAIVNRNDPARTRMSQQRNSENNAAARQALQDPAVRQDIHAFVMGRESQLQGSRAGEMAQAARQVALYRDVVAPKMQVATAVVGKSVAG